MDNNNRPEYNDRERHNSIKKKLKIVGFICLIAGAVFTAIGLIALFASMGGSDLPTKVWCAFVGLPLLGIGFAITSFAFRREISRYVKNESVPVINEAGKELTPAVRDIASAVKEGLSDSTKDEIRCSCGTLNNKGSKFCKECGKSFVSICPHCGQEIPADSAFCNHCGSKLS